MAESQSLRLVPFNNSWVQHDKLDLHAIYRRPRYVQNDLDEQVVERDANGQVIYDTTTALPVRQHNKWLAKGFEYVTLATRNDLRQAFDKGTLFDERGQHVDWRQFDQHQTGGPWHFKLYQRGQQQGTGAYLEMLREQVRKFGSDAVEEIRREANPNFVLPASLRGVPPGGPLPDDVTPPAPDATPVVTTERAARRSEAAAPKGKKAKSDEPELVGGFAG